MTVYTHLFFNCLLDIVTLITLRQKTILVWSYRCSARAYICPDLFADTVTCSCTKLCSTARNSTSFRLQYECLHLWFQRVKKWYHCYKTMYHWNLRLQPIHWRRTVLKVRCNKLSFSCSELPCFIIKPTFNKEWYIGSKEKVISVPTYFTYWK